MNPSSTPNKINKPIPSKTPATPKGPKKTGQKLEQEDKDRAEWEGMGPPMPEPESDRKIRPAVERDIERPTKDE